MTLRELRKSQGISPSYVAKKLDISYRQFLRIEKGEAKLTNKRKKILAKIYGVKMSEITEQGGVKN